MRLRRGAYWLIGWLLTVAVTYAGTQCVPGRGIVAPVVPGAATLILASCCASLASCSRADWVGNGKGLLVAGLGILSVGLGLANLLR